MEKKIKISLKNKYSGKMIVENKIGGQVTEIVCEIDPAFEHPAWSRAIAFIYAGSNVFKDPAGRLRTINLQRQLIFECRRNI